MRPSSFIRRQTSNPLISGRPTSSTITAGRTTGASASASLPDVTMCGANPAFSRLGRKKRTVISSSSATRMGVARPSLSLIARYPFASGVGLTPNPLLSLRMARGSQGSINRSDQLDNTYIASPLHRNGEGPGVRPPLFSIRARRKCARSSSQKKWLNDMLSLLPSYPSIHLLLTNEAIERCRSSFAHIECSVIATILALFRSDGSAPGFQRNEVNVRGLIKSGPVR